MPAIQFKCPERGCDKTSLAWVPDRPQHQSEHNADAACKKHKKKYELIYQKHVEECERLGIRT